ncbi:MAG: aerotolerance regulator BatA [Bacteroidetes bacterium HGW-Bacteroidetes-6]|jgi:Ca-activated chloride channel family protein|nr:MAG: aerotolerance regulator BatA [Bacteroidetes bacterium HGW-Bacteroidetes-6]
MKWPSDISFEHPWAFLLMAVIPLMVWWYIRNFSNQRHAVNLPSLQSIKNVGRSFREQLFRSMPAVRMIAIAMIIVAVARPQTYSFHDNYNIEGIDIILVNDVSGSMLAEDFKPNRLEAAKTVADQFIAKRPNDRIGLVAFSGAAFTQCPLTADHAVLKRLLADIKNGIVRDGTAIGDAVGIAVDRLRYSKAESKVIILLTDGINNSGFVDPRNAASMAKLYGIRLYAVGVGSYGEAPYPVQTLMGTSYSYVKANLDEDLLKEMAEATGGKYFRATDNESLETVYGEIDQMEKTRIDVSRMSDKHDLFFYPVFLSIALLLLEIFLRYSFLRIMP